MSKQNTVATANGGADAAASAKRRSFTGRLPLAVEQLDVVDHVSPCSIVPVLPRYFNRYALVDALIPLTHIRTRGRLSARRQPKEEEEDRKEDDMEKMSERSTRKRNRSRHHEEDDGDEECQQQMQEALNSLYAMHLDKVHHVPRLMALNYSSSSNVDTRNGGDGHEAVKLPSEKKGGNEGQKTILTRPPPALAAVQWCDGTISPTGDLDGLHHEEYLRLFFKHYNTSFSTSPSTTTSLFSSPTSPSSTSSSSSPHHVVAPLGAVIQEQTRRLLLSKYEAAPIIPSTSSATVKNNDGAQVAPRLKLCRISDLHYSIPALAVRGSSTNSIVGHRLHVDRFFSYEVTFAPDAFPQLSTGKHDVVLPFSEALRVFSLVDYDPTAASSSSKKDKEAEEEDKELTTIMQLWKITLQALMLTSAKRINMMITVLRLTRTPQTRTEYMDDIRAILGSYAGIPDVATLLELLRDELLFQGLRWPNNMRVVSSTAATTRKQQQLPSRGGRPSAKQGKEMDQQQEEAGGDVFSEWDLIGGENFFLKLAAESTASSSAALGAQGTLSMDGATAAAFSETKAFLHKCRRAMTYDELFQTAFKQK